MPKEFREAHNLQPPKLLTLSLAAPSGGWKSIDFYAHLRTDGQVTIPVELYCELELRHKQTVLLRVLIN